MLLLVCGDVSVAVYLKEPLHFHEKDCVRMSVIQKLTASVREIGCSHSQTVIVLNDLCRGEKLVQMQNG
jgi:hypothetical protein